MKDFLRKISYRLLALLAVWVLLTEVMPKRWYLGTDYLRWEKVWERMEEEKLKGGPIDIVMGDSRPEMGLNSCELDAVNFGLGGTSPVEGYYMLQKLKPLKIRRIYLSYSPFHFQSQDCFHNRAGHFGFVEEAYLKEVLEFSKSQGDTVYQYNNWVWLDELDRNYPSEKVQKLLRYLPAMRNFELYQKYFRNHEQVEQGLAQNCNSYLFESSTCPKDIKVYEKELEELHGRFAVNPVNLFYFRKMLEEIQSSGMELVWINMPLNEACIQPSARYYADFESWLKSELPASTPYQPLTFQPSCDFIDLSHLNKQAATAFAKQMASQFP